MIIKTEKIVYKEITNPQDIAEILKKILKSEDPIDQDKEHFWSIGLNNRNQIVYIELVSLGTLNSSLVHPRETFRLAIMKGVASIMVAHNHPSGDTTPSMEDILLTKRLNEAGKIIGIDLIDHIIISKTSFISFKEKKLI
jgi:DNA repair protein RadC